MSSSRRPRLRPHERDGRICDHDDGGHDGGHDDDRTRRFDDDARRSRVERGRCRRRTGLHPRSPRHPSFRAYRPRPILMTMPPPPRPTHRPRPARRRPRALRSLLGRSRSTRRPSTSAHGPGTNCHAHQPGRPASDVRGHCRLPVHRVSQVVASSRPANRCRSPSPSTVRRPPGRGAPGDGHAGPRRAGDASASMNLLAIVERPPVSWSTAHRWPATARGSGSRCRSGPR